MKIGRARVHVWRRIRAKGVLATMQSGARYLWRKWRRDAFDRENGTDTSGIEPLWQFTISSENREFGGRYHASEEWEISAAIRLIPEDLSGFTFIDLGCGKGRALLIASRLGFKRVIGVEFATELAQIARKNLRKAGLTNATVIDGDAADFVFPERDLAVFLFHPFQAQVVEKVAQNLLRANGTLYVIYSNPLHAETFDGTERFRRVGATPARWLPTIVWKLETERLREAAGSDDGAGQVSVGDALGE